MQSRQHMQVCREDDAREAREHVRTAWLSQLGSAPRRGGRSRGAGKDGGLHTPEKVRSSCHDHAAVAVYLHTGIAGASAGLTLTCADVWGFAPLTVAFFMIGCNKLHHVVLRMNPACYCARWRRPWRTHSGFRRSWTR